MPEPTITKGNHWMELNLAAEKYSEDTGLSARAHTNFSRLKSGQYDRHSAFS